MQSNTGPNFLTDDIIAIDLHVPDPDVLKNALQTGLSELYFFEVTVDWVICPNLTKEPFNLAAEGICGKTAILDFCGPLIKRKRPIQNLIAKEYKLTELLYKLNFFNKQEFVFGTGVARRTSGELTDFVMNQRFLPSVNEVRPYTGKSCFIYTKERTCYVETILHYCMPQLFTRGTFFLCEGTASTVLKICAKVKTSTRKCPSQFINSLQIKINEQFENHGYNIALGGVYTVNVINSGWKHKTSSSDYCHIKTFESIISIFNSSIELPTPRRTRYPSIRLNSLQSGSCLSHQHVSYSDSEFDENDGVVEFTGYFSPAQKLFLVDKPLFTSAVQ